MDTQIKVMDFDDNVRLAEEYIMSTNKIVNGYCQTQNVFEL